MLFNSFAFILAFLPLVLIGFELTRRRAGAKTALGFLLAASLAFYSWWDWRLTGLLLSSVCTNYLFGRILARNPSRLILAIGVAANLGLLGWFKYANFFVDTVNLMAGTHFTVGHVLLPLAISFFTFQQISYLVDVKRGIVEETNLIRYALFVTFFPHLIAGPIVHHSDLLAQFRKPSGMRVDWSNLATGLGIFAIGLFKKVVIADNVAPYADQVFGAAQSGDALTLITAWTAVAAFTLQIYFDFSGYSDMALGLARMMGVKLPLNFNSPYKATSIIEFWRRWHMSLSRFLREYLYIPLGGNRSGRGRQYANLMAVMLLGGLWHGANWTFIAWGGLHGLYLLVAHLWRQWRGEESHSNRIATVTGAALTLVAVMIAWTLFRSPDWATAAIMFKGMSGAAGAYLPESYAGRLGFLSHVGVLFQPSPDAGLYPTLGELGRIVFLFLVVWLTPNTQQLLSHFPAGLAHLQRSPSTLWDRWALRPTASTGILIGLVFVAGLIHLAIAHENEFIYFQF